MQVMLNTMEDFAIRYNISFSTILTPENLKAIESLLLEKTEVLRNQHPFNYVVTIYYGYRVQYLLAINCMRLVIWTRIQ